MSAVEDHQDDMVAIMDSLGEDYPERFLDEQGELRPVTAGALSVLATMVAAGQLSLWELDRVFEEWGDLFAAFSDGYGLQRLYDLWSANGSGGEAQWPDPGARRFFEGWAVELDRYLKWCHEGRLAPFGDSDGPLTFPAERRAKLGLPPLEQPPTRPPSSSVHRHRTGRTEGGHHQPGRLRQRPCP